jgi:hypothetical protein
VYPDYKIERYARRNSSIGGSCHGTSRPWSSGRTEGQAANIYWSAWTGIQVNFSAKDTERVPEHWLTFGRRHSLISQPSPRRAINPPNALLNYLYASLEAEARISVLRMGLDPGLGLLHAEQKNRDSLPCDLMKQSAQGSMHTCLICFAPARLRRAISSKRARAFAVSCRR